MQDRVPPQFDRNARLWGAVGAERLAASRVMVVGLGGVGSYAAEALIRAGIGRLTLVDFDAVCITNVNRQLHAMPASVGEAKAELMARRAKAINPAAEVEGIRTFYEAATARRLLVERPDVIIDCIDNVTAKLHLLATCIVLRQPVVTTLGASGRIDPTRVRFAELRNTCDDPLGKTIRKNLWRKYQVNLRRVSHLLAVFSDEVPVSPDPGYVSAFCGSTCVCPSRDNPHHTCEQRHVIWGSSVFVTSVAGMTAASLVVRHLLGDRQIDLKPVMKVLPGDDPMIDPLADEGSALPDGSERPAAPEPLASSDPIADGPAAGRSEVRSDAPTGASGHRR